MLLELEDIRVSYGAAEVVKGVSMKVEEGSIVCVIGANGAGKTTTLRAISGLERATSGEIRFRGERINRASPQSIVERGIVQIPERGRPFPDMSVYENLMMGAYLRKDKLESSRDLEMVYEFFPVLKDRNKQTAGSLSGGERQMLAIGRALMSKPTILLMDEPSLGLAPKLVATMGEIILGLHNRGISIVLVEQNARMALSLADRGYVMETGRIILEGDAKALANDKRVIKAYLGG
jgi:branched-chain amino acid transport system ATP-binding protein